MASELDSKFSPLDWLYANIRFRELLALIANLVIALAVFVPWIYAFSPPSGPTLEITQVAAPNLVGLFLHSDYPYLIGIPIGVGFGLLFILTPTKTRRSYKVALVALAFGLTLAANFLFGMQSSSEVGLLMDGQHVSYSVTQGPGSRLAGVGSFLYLASLFVTVLTE